jgi:DedD protein
MDQQLKQRLIGITIVVALVVIFVPMLFDEKDEGSRTVATGVPPIPDDVMERTLELPKSADDVAAKEKEEEGTRQGSTGYRIIPLTDEAPAPKPADVTAKTAEAPSAKPEEAQEPPAEEDEIAPAPEKAAPPAPVEKPATTKPPKPAVEPKKARTPPAPPTPMAKKPEPIPPPAPPTKAKPPAAKATESPPRKADAAETVHPDSELLDTQPFKSPAPKPAAKPPVKPAPAPAAGKPGEPPQSADLTAWVVQTGSFTSEAKAKALAEKLRQARFPAFVERARTGTGTTYRVQVGPELERGRAEQTLKQIETSVGIKGIIVPHP